MVSGCGQGVTSGAAVLVVGLPGYPGRWRRCGGTSCFGVYGGAFQFDSGSVIGWVVLPVEERC
jgi:hypothetical protein